MDESIEGQAQVSLGGGVDIPDASDSRGYGDDFEDEDAEEAPTPRPQGGAQASDAAASAGPTPAAAESDARPVSERVAEFIKKTSLLGDKDPRLAAVSIFAELLRSKRLTEWNEAECVVWLSSIGLERYRAQFFHNHVTGRTLDRLTRPKPGDKPGLEKLKEDIGIGALGHRELLLDEIMEVQASKSEQAARFNRGRQQQRQLEKSEERELERMHIELLRLEVEYKDAEAVLIKARLAEEEKLKAVKGKRHEIEQFQRRLKGKHKDAALQNYGRISDLKQCTFRPELTVQSATYDDDRGPMWERIQSEMNQKQQKLRDLKQVADSTQGMLTYQSRVQSAKLFLVDYLMRDSTRPEWTAKIKHYSQDEADPGIEASGTSETHPCYKTIKEALKKGEEDGHCRVSFCQPDDASQPGFFELASPKTGEKVKLKGTHEGMLLQVSNVLRVNRFLADYKQTKAVVEPQPDWVPKKLKESQIRERAAKLAEVPGSRPSQPLTPEQEMAAAQARAREEKRQKRMEEVREKKWKRFMAKYEKDMHQRRLNAKEATRRGAEADRAKMQSPMRNRRNLLGEL